MKLPDNIEVFKRTKADNKRDGWLDDCTGEPYNGGWYYWYCFPGCLPESDATGPFRTAKQAVKHAWEYTGDFF